MRRWLFSFGLLLLPGAGAAAGGDKVLNVYNWADYIGETTVADFEAESGVEVNYDLYDSTAVVDARLLTGKSGYDVVLTAVRYSARLIEVGVFRPLDRGRLPLWGNLDPWVLDAMSAYDPGNRYAVPYMWGTTGFAYNVGMVRERMPDAPLDSAALVFAPENAARFADCGISLLDESTMVIPMVMQYLGHDANSIGVAELAEAEAVLKSIRPYIRYFSSAKMAVYCGDTPYAGGTTLELGYAVEVQATPEQVWKPLERIGGPNGWYFGTGLWKIRGWADRS